jgi:hypothetical protein
MIKRLERLKKILLINIWRTNEQIDFDLSFRTEVSRKSMTKCMLSDRVIAKFIHLLVKAR